MSTFLSIPIGTFRPETRRWGTSRGSRRAAVRKPIGSSSSGDVFSWTISTADLGGTTGITFNVSAIALVSSPSGSGGKCPDLAPNTGGWTYDLSPPPPAPASMTTPGSAVKPLIGAPATIPPKAIAGIGFTVSFRVTRNDTGAPLTGGKMICDPAIAGKVISHTESFTGGGAKLSFTVPKTAKGKLLKVKPTIKLGTQSTTKAATFRIG